MKIPLNFAILENPLNWIIVTVIVAIGGLMVALLFPHSAAVAKPEN